MKKQLTYMITGIGIGAFAYLLTLISVEATNGRQVISILLMSGLIGWTAQVYEKENLSLPNRWLLHLLMVLVPVSIMLLINGWFNLSSLALTIVSYALVFWGIRFISGGRHA